MKVIGMVKRKSAGGEDMQIRMAPTAAAPLRDPSFERHVIPVPELPLFFDMLRPGMELTSSKTVSEGDINAFAEVSGDKNPVHVDAEYASTTMFGERIAHGMLTAGIVEAVFRNQFPGPGAAFVSMTLNFRGPVRINDVVETKVRLQELMQGTSRGEFEFECTAKGKIVLEGLAILSIPRKNEKGETVV